MSDTVMVMSVQADWAQRHEQDLADFGELSASLFRFASGVPALRLRSSVANIVLLPWQGHQIWSAAFNGRDITMATMFEQPWPTTDYMRTYGGLLIHCGVTAMGPPGPEDSHPVHGELPNATYDDIAVRFGSDARGEYVAVTGRHRYTVAFNTNYDALPEVRLYAGETCCEVSFNVTNLKRTPMDFMYLAHINMRPVDNATLHYSAIKSPEHVRVRTSIPGHVTVGPGYAEFLDELAKDPTIHHTLKPELQFDPEVVFAIDYLADADADGNAYSVQRHPDGQADYIRHRPSQLPHCVRWLSRTADQDCHGLALPATAGVEGFKIEKEKGNVMSLGPGETFHCDYTIGCLDADGADRLIADVETVVGNAAG